MHSRCALIHVPQPAVNSAVGSFDGGGGWEIPSWAGIAYSRLGTDSSFFGGPPLVAVARPPSLHSRNVCVCVCVHVFKPVGFLSALSALPLHKPAPKGSTGRLRLYLIAPRHISAPGLRAFRTVAIAAVAAAWATCPFDRQTPDALASSRTFA